MLYIRLSALVCDLDYFVVLFVTCDFGCGLRICCWLMVVCFGFSLLLWLFAVVFCVCLFGLLMLIV